MRGSPLGRRILHVRNCDDHDEGSGYRTGSSCDRDCESEVTTLEEPGVRVTYLCVVYGVYSTIDPFGNRR